MPTTIRRCCPNGAVQRRRRPHRAARRHARHLRAAVAAVQRLCAEMATIWMPKGVHATYDPDKWFDFPAGTIVSKTFYYTVPAGTADPQASGDVVKMTPALYQDGVHGLDLKRVRLIEDAVAGEGRRLGGLANAWNADGTDATLERTGVDVPLDLPRRRDDDALHLFRAQSEPVRRLSRAGLPHPFGGADRAQSRHLDRDFAGPGGEINQLRRLVALGYLTGVPAQGRARNVAWSDPRLPVSERALSYLDINCSHCHNASGAARTSGLWLDTSTTDLRARGLCKPPVAAGRGTGDRSFAMVPGHPEQSIIAWIALTAPIREMMPELGRALVHREGSALVQR
ncbi:hypothetical protein AB5I41_08275 [Sphingomonas sp. MMS24-JH45]